MNIMPKKHEKQILSMPKAKYTEETDTINLIIFNYIMKLTRLELSNAELWN